MMERQVSLLVKLIDELLDLSRIATGKVVLQHETADMRSIVETALESTRPFVDATLAVFEARATDTVASGSTLTAGQRAAGFGKMQALVRRLHEHGARLVMGGHTEVPHAGRGEAPWRELELLVASGLSATEALTAATSNAAAFLGTGGSDLGAIRAGAAADLVAVDGHADSDISLVRRVRLVMVAGQPVPLDRLRTL